MKSPLTKRLYAVLPRSSPSPRPRSGSHSSSLYTLTTTTNTLSIFDSPPPPPAGPHNPSSSSRIPPKPKQQQHQSSPNPLALTPAPQPSPAPPSHLQSLALSYPYSPPIVPGFSNALILPHLSPAKDSDAAQRRARRKRASRVRYSLETGAYGIPKKHTPAVHRPLGLDLAVPVGEDAYFVRDDAVGVADGIGGWAKARAGRPPVTVDNAGMGVGVSPSAMFATRMMHCVSDELKIARPDDYLQLLSDESPFEDDDLDTFESQSDIEEELEYHLEELEDGIDILQVLEQAYERTWKGHVDQRTGERVVLGGATVMVAALDWAEEDKSSDPASTSATDSSPERTTPAPDPELTPVLKIAQIGDCMGMLVRGDDIVWRSEEMWWGYNTPVQLSPPPLSRSSSPEGKPVSLSPLMENASGLLGPLLASRSPTRNLYTQAAPSPAPSPLRSSPIPSPPRCASPPLPRPTSPSNHAPPANPITPRTTARVVTLPVQADDILVLASDGLSDNLWDEEVLDEVMRFKGWGGGAVSESGLPTPPLSPSGVSPPTLLSTPHSSITALLQRHTLAAKLSEALCSRARRVSERRHGDRGGLGSGWLGSPNARDVAGEIDWDETPFGRRARELGRVFRGGKRDDISVVVAVVSPPAVAQMPTL